MERRLTLKQRRFVAYLLGPANGNQTAAARMAGYRGDDRQLAVQGSVNMRNLQIQEMLDQALESMVKPSLKRLREALDATKRRAFITKTGEIRYTDPEPYYQVRVATANQLLDLYERSNRDAAACDAAGYDEEAKPRRELRNAQTAKMELD